MTGRGRARQRPGQRGPHGSASHLGVLVIARHPYRAVGAVLGAMALCIFVSGMVGQHNEGPWGGLPAWVGAAGWFGFLGLSLVMLALCAYLAVAHLRYRKAVA